MTSISSIVIMGRTAGAVHAQPAHPMITTRTVPDTAERWLLS
ncbi:hypothetical protein HVIM_03869 (plasmid) [Roseomonas mucosa]|nr:hypothetical protein [Roseomonas mucosa]MDU7520631.1 hypothetical protein [Roseomonas mucosa]QDD92784.1 hypothetical protein HVIM_03869 [Roseomonas mucosa]